MKDIIERLQDWYKLNCNGDWEHSYGYSIATLDNPGWTIRISLCATVLEDLEFHKEFQNPQQEHDWYHITTKKQVLEIACGPDNLKQVLQIFLDEIIPNYSNREYTYEVYLPLRGLDVEIWTPANAIMINEQTLRLVHIAPIKYLQIKVKDLALITFTEDDLSNLQPAFKVGDIINFTIEEFFDGVSLIAVANEG